MSSSRARLDKFMAHLEHSGEASALAKYGDPEIWNQCKHGRELCRHRDHAHAARECVHEQSPMFPASGDGEQLGLFG